MSPLHHRPRPSGRSEPCGVWRIPDDVPTRQGRQQASSVLREILKQAHLVAPRIVEVAVSDDTLDALDR